jgi:hypothetical protein
MKKGFVASVLSTPKQRQRFIWGRNMVALICAVGVYHTIGGALGVGLGVVALIGSYFTVAPVIAFIACLFEQMYS